jgi:hypothetical protein
MSELVPKSASRTVIAARGANIVPAVIADAGAASVTATLELKRAVHVTERAGKLWDLDAAIVALRARYPRVRARARD